MRKITSLLVLSIALFFSVKVYAQQEAISSKKEKIIKLGDSVVLTLVYVPPGNFTIGAEGFYKNETPEKAIALTHGFWVGKTEVTQAQFSKIMGFNPSGFNQKTNFANTDDHPVDSVSWYDCIRFCNKLSILTKLQPCYLNPEDKFVIADGETVSCNWDNSGFRLPTEAEWEYLCKGGKDIIFPWKDSNNHSEVDKFAWYCNNCKPFYGKTPCATIEGTQVVGQKVSNPFGLFDMHGNVFEFCWDWWQSDYYSSAPKVDPTGPQVGTKKISRGGSYGNDAEHLRSTYRFPVEPTEKQQVFGFRVLRAINP